MNKNETIFSETIGQTYVSKTLKNTMIPIGATQLNIEKNGLITEDKIRSEKRQELKEIMDDYYRYFISNMLSGNLAKTIEWGELFDAIDNNYINNSDKTKNELENIQMKKRTELNKLFKSNDDYKKMFNAKLLSDILPEFINKQKISNTEKEERLNTVNLFNKFTSSFTDFFTNRENIFADDKSTSICYRIVNENAWIFYQNYLIYNKIKEDAEKEIITIENNNVDGLDGFTLNSIFNFDFYGMLINQKGIRFYNDICGIVNAHMNLYCQKYKKKAAKYRLKRMHKQILSIDESTFEVPKMLESDKEVYDLVNGFLYKLNEKKVLDRIRKISEDVTSYDLNKIYVCEKNYENLSLFMCRNWSILRESIKAFYQENTTGSSAGKEKKIEKLMKEDKYRSLQNINELINKYNSNSIERKAEEYIVNINEKLENKELVQLTNNEDISLIEDEESGEELKRVLDLIMSINHWIKMFIIDEEVDKDMAFYTEIEDIYYELEPLKSIYDKVRNYITQKPYSKEKIKLNFGIPTLASGWSKTKEYDNNAIILIRENKYYIGIFNAKNKPDKTVIEGHKKKSDSDYKKMVYMFLPKPYLMLPKAFLSKKGIATYKTSEYILDGYKKKKHIKSSKNFDVNYCRDLIDYFKECINKRDEWKGYKFKFSETSTYEDINDFYKEIEKQAYTIQWTYIDEKDIDEMNEKGQLYLFQIYNKDFSEKSTGTKNLHTMYFENLFSEENLKNIVLKLDGNAEVFFRKSSIKQPIIHKKGSILVNKGYNEQKENEERKTIPDEVYTELYKYFNKIGEVKLSNEAKKLIDEGKVEYFTSDYDIVKDYRYTVDKYFLHLPIKINCNAENYSPVNDIALKNIAENNDMHIIGIDRGERNLIYVSVIDLHGNIIEQKNFNIINGVNYKEKLKQRESERDSARKNWKQIGKIKDIKEGYLSLVIHEITSLVLKYNAIIAMEDLNMGFKRGRFKVERQVYQKFENMLISKLNYLVDKNKAVNEEGGVLKGYQMTYIPKSLKELGRQCGYIFYVPAAYTSKIDPTTGFVSVFNYKEMDDEKFVTSFDSIKYDKNRQKFALKFDYTNFITHNVKLAKNEWTIYSNGTRKIRKYRNGKWNSPDNVNLTNEIIKLMEQYKIQYDNEQDILEQVETLETKNKNNFCKEMKKLVKYIVQMRNSLPDNDSIEYDEIISPVLNEAGEFYNSEEKNKKLPLDADANGAYCIALKGLYEVKQIKNNWKEDEKFPRKTLKISHNDWFDFIQNKRYL